MDRVKATYRATCTECREGIRKGSWVVSLDGFWVHPKCAVTDESLMSDPAPTVDTMSDEFEDPTPRTIGSAGPADDFEDPTPRDEVPPGLVHRGRYLITDPVTGDFRRYKTSGKIDGFTRATTFVKSATDSKALNDWGKRNVVIGAAARPDLAAKAYGLKNEDGNRRVLDDLVEELYVAANAHVPAQQGTDLHDLRERLDAGKITMDEVPPVWRRNLELYYDALYAYGLVPVAGLSERVTMTHKYGGVAGRFDQVYHHTVSDTYLMGDQKTGKTMDYGSKEVPAQLSIYTDGVNEHGVYDPERQVWERPVDRAGNRIWIRTDVGLVLHMPVQGDRAGTFRFLDVDLDVGRRYADLCAENRAFKAPKLTEWDGTLPGAPEPEATWDDVFSSVTDQETASLAWEEARKAGVPGLELNRLVALAQQALRTHGVMG